MVAARTDEDAIEVCDTLAGTRKRPPSGSPGSDNLQQPSKTAKSNQVNKVIVHHGAKKHWKLRSKQRPTLVIADQNVEFVRPATQELEVHCFPGLTLDYLKNISKVENASPGTSRVIIWAGHNDLHRESFDFSIARLWKASLTNIRKAFPNASIWAVQVVCPPNAPAIQRINCHKTNQLLSSHRSANLISLDARELTFRRDQISLERLSADAAFDAILETAADLSKN